MNRTRRSIAALTVAGGLLLSGCGGNGSSAGTTPAGASSFGRYGGPGAGFDPAEFSKIDACLKAAGIKTFTPPSPGITGSPVPRPTSFPTAFPSGVPSGGFSRGPFGRPSGGGRFSDPQVVKALKACGISLPTFPHVTVSPSS